MRTRSKTQTKSGRGNLVHTSISTLPVGLLARILQHVPQQQRLTSCALVSKGWAAAAAAATVRIDVNGLDSSKTASAQSWIEHHARQLQSLQLHSSRTYSQHHVHPHLQLPCADLQQLSALHLSGLQPLPQQPLVRTSSSSTLSSFLPNLQDLRLNALLVDSADTLLQFGQCTGVTQLKIASVIFVTPGVPWQHTFFASEIEARKNQAAQTTAAVLGLLESMTQLQCLHFELGPMENEAWMAAVFPTSITALKLSLDMTNTDREEQPCVPDSLHHLTELQELQLEIDGGGIDPSLLAAKSRLRMLTLRYCALLPNPAGVAGPDALLAAMECMQHLQHLTLDDGDGNSDAEHTLSTAQPSSCAALTASSHLTHLEVVNGSDPAVPPAALKHMFPPGHSLPQLQTLILSYEEGHDHVTPFITGAELADIGSACPALKTLDIICALQPGDSVSALLELPQTVNALRIGGEAFGDNAVATVVQLTQLTSLQWVSSNCLTDAGLYQLTALTGLQELFLRDDNGLTEGLVNKHEGMMQGVVQLLAYEQPVWQQLRDCVLESPAAAWIVRLEDQQRQLEDLQESNAQLQQESCSRSRRPLGQRVQPANAQLQQENQRLQQANAQLQQENQRLQQANAQLQQDNQRMQQANAQLQQEDQRWQQANAQLLQDNQHLQQANAQLQQDTQHLQQANAQLQQDTQRWQQQSAQLQQENQHLQQANAQLQQENQRMQQANAQLQQEDQHWQQQSAQRQEHCCQE